MSPRQCRCNLPVQERTSWTAQNPGRRYFTCGLDTHHSGTTRCGFFEWIDVETSNRDPAEYVPLLNRKIQRLLSELKTKDDELQRFIAENHMLRAENQILKRDPELDRMKEELVLRLAAFGLAEKTKPSSSC